MTTNLKRTVVAEEERAPFFLVRYSTGAVTITDRSRDRLVLSLTNAQELHETGYLDKLFSLVTDTQAAAVVSSFSAYGIGLEYSPSFAPAVKHTLDSKLSSAAKLAYIISILHSGIRVSPESLDRVFAVRPEPLEAAASLTPALQNPPHSWIQTSLLPDFASPRREITTDAEYRSYCLRVSFLGAQSSVRYGDFIREAGENFFIPVYPSMAWAGETLYSDVKLSHLEDLYPIELQRFMRYFNAGIAKELRSWALKRFRSGVKPIRELRDRGLVTGSMIQSKGYLSAFAWMPAMNLMSEDEAREFASYLAQEQSMARVFSGVDDASASLVVFYWLEGGAKRLDELSRHIHASLREDGLMGSYPNLRVRLALEWRNPFIEQRGRRPDLKPYVQALTSPVLRELPLEIGLASYVEDHRP